MHGGQIGSGRMDLNEDGEKGSRIVDKEAGLFGEHAFARCRRHRRLLDAVVIAVALARAALRRRSFLLDLSDCRAFDLSFVPS